MGGIEAHRKRRQVETAGRSQVMLPKVLCPLVCQWIRRLIVCAKHICLAEKKSSPHYLNSKPQRSLHKLQLKFVQTTRVVCTDYS